MKKNFFRILICVVTVIAVSCTSKNEPSATTQQGSVRNIDGIEVVSLYGTWEQMGEQYGTLAGAHLRHLQEGFEVIINGDTAKRDSIVGLAKKLYSRYPYRLQQFFKGMERTSGLTMEQLLMNNAVEYAEGFFCSGIAAWDDYAAGNLVYGRNYDAVHYSRLAEDIIVTVYHPSDGALATATIGYAGEIYAVNAINEKGLFMELNNGMPSGGWDLDYERFATTTTLFEMMFNAADMDYMDAYFKSSLSFGSFIIGVADQNEARSYEICAEGVENATGCNPAGLMVQTNHYISPNWSFETPTDEESWNSITRRRNLLSMAEENKGRIDEEAMCRIVATSLEDGGAMQRDLTRYQIVYTPATKRVLVRVEQGEKWSVINLNEIF